MLNYFVLILQLNQLSNILNYKCMSMNMYDYDDNV